MSILTKQFKDSTINTDLLKAVTDLSGTAGALLVQAKISQEIYDIVDAMTFQIETLALGSEFAMEFRAYKQKKIVEMINQRRPS